MTLVPQAPLPPSPPPRVVRNIRARADRDTCAQAAAATVLGTLGVAPFDGGALSDAGAIDRVRAAFPPDLGPFGTSAWRLAAALRAHGVEARVSHSGPFGLGASRAWERVRERLARGVPVPVCLDDGMLGGAPWAAHWALALGLDGERVALGNAGAVRSLDLPRFMAAWRCRHLPWPYDHCAVLAGPGATVTAGPR